MVLSSPYITSDATGGPTTPASVEFLADIDGMLLEDYVGFTASDPGDTPALQWANAQIAPSAQLLSLDYGGTPSQLAIYNASVAALGILPGFSVNANYDTGPATPVPATAGNDSLTGTSLADSIEGLDGNDTLIGRWVRTVCKASLATISLSAGRTAICCWAARAMTRSSVAAAMTQWRAAAGDGGVDAANYYFAGGGVRVNLSLQGASQNITSGQGFDLLSGFGNMLGSANFDNLLRGGALDTGLQATAVAARTRFTAARAKISSAAQTGPTRWMAASATIS